MYHSLIFVDGNVSKNTWDNWHLIPSSRPVVSRPTTNYKYVDIPGMDGSLDLSNYLVGRPTYSDCSGSFEFYVANDYGDWASRKSELSSFLDGREMKMFLEDDPQYYYLGRFALSSWKAGPNFSSVTIDYHVRPYKFKASNGEKVWA
jgi:phage-related protein